MDKIYSTFWIDYCNGAVALDPKFNQRDVDYCEECSDHHLNLHGKVSTMYGHKRVHGNNPRVCDIEGKQV